MDYDDDFKTELQKETEANAKLENFGRTKEQQKAADNIENLDEFMMMKYETVQRIGKGAYGVAWKAIEKYSSRKVCIKKVFDAFSDDTDAQRTFREVYINMEIGEHANIIKIENLRRALNKMDFYIIFELMEADLHTVIRAEVCRDIQIRFISWQLLSALKFVHSANVVHRDIKPSNILINKTCLIKLADFGLARCMRDVDTYVEPVLTDYIATRWYRAPEILLSTAKYNSSIDMWGFGCIVAELYISKPLFPGSSTLNQIQRILELTGVPTERDLQEIHSPLALTVFQKLANFDERRHIDQMVPGAPDDALDLISKCLKFRPSSRLTAEQALQHPYVQEFHSEFSHQESKCRITMQLPIDDNKKATKDEYRKYLESMVKKKNEEIKMQRRQDKYGIE